MDILLACLPALPSAVASPFLPVLAPLIRRCGAAAALLLQEDFKGVVGKAQGFAYRPERPERWAPRVLPFQFNGGPTPTPPQAA